MTQTTKPKGFAAMSTEKRRHIASLGGKAGHALGVSHEWTPQEASEAGKKGGRISRRRPKPVS